MGRLGVALAALAALVACAPLACGPDRPREGGIGGTGACASPEAAA